MPINVSEASKRKKIITSKRNHPEPADGHLLRPCLHNTFV
jgi:hypothetical protein